MAAYYKLLRSILKEKPHLRKCLAKCRHCRILFFTHPRNAGRKDLRCPFGCRQTHRRESAIERSIDYYKSDVGKIKKRIINRRRNEPVADAIANEPSGRSCKTGVDATTIGHIKLTTSLIEGRAVDLKETTRLVEKILRQLSFEKSKKIGYIHGRSKTNPP